MVAATGVPARGDGHTCPYDERTYADWAAEALAAAYERWKPFTSSEVVLELRLTGPCPRCLHLDGIAETIPALTPVLETDVQVAVLEIPNAKRPEAKLKTIFCRCAEKHEGRNEGDKGCGMFGEVVVKT